MSVRFEMRLPDDLAEAVDKACSAGSRAAWITDAIRSALEHQCPPGRTLIDVDDVLLQRVDTKLTTGKTARGMYVDRSLVAALAYSPVPGTHVRTSQAIRAELERRHVEQGLAR